MTDHTTVPMRLRYADIRLTAEQQEYFLSHGATVADNVIIRGPLPLIKTPFNGRLVIGGRTILNSDNDGSNTPVPTPIKFVIGRDATIRIGQNCDLNGAALTAYQSITIGDRVQIGAAGLIADTDFHPLAIVNRRDQMLGKPVPFDLVAKEAITIEDDVWIGYNVMILKGVTIGHGSILGAGSIVTTSIPPLCIAAGNPAQVIRHLDSES